MSKWYTTFIKSLIKDIATEGNLPLSNFRGCSVTDLDILMKSQMVNQLPEMYRQFMLQMGNGFDSRLDDMLWTVNELLEFKKENISFVGQGTFIFMWHIDVFTLYGFSTIEESNNPKVLMWDESLSEHRMIQTGDKLSEFLISFFAPHLPD